MTGRARLSDALALAARPRERECVIHDTALQGFMLRVRPNPVSVTAVCGCSC